MRGLEDSLVYSRHLPVLDVLTTPKRNVPNQTFTSDIYVGVNQINTGDIEMYILDDGLQSVSFEDKPVKVTLDFKRKP